MAIKQSAKKEMRASAKRRLVNMRKARAMKMVVKDVRDRARAGDVSEASTKLRDAYAAIDKAAQRGVIKKNTAARKKSRLARLLRRK